MYTAGRARNIHFPFDIVHDTAIDVAFEMVKELEISDWEPLEIAGMIEEEISSLVPTWKDWDTSHYHHQHSFSYEEDEDDDGTHHPFDSASSCSSSVACIPTFSSYCKSYNGGNNMASRHDWLHGTCMFLTLLVLYMSTHGQGSSEPDAYIAVEIECRYFEILVASYMKS